MHIFALYLCFILYRFNMTSVTLVNDNISELQEGKILSEFVQSNHRSVQRLHFTCREVRRDYE